MSVRLFLPSSVRIGAKDDRGPLLISKTAPRDPVSSARFLADDPKATKPLAPLNRAGQAHRAAQAMRDASCEEVRCSWFMFGHEGEDEGAPFVHPAGVECGDFNRCWHPNCPCPARRRTVGHRVPVESIPTRFQIARYSRDGEPQKRTVTASEFLDTLREGQFRAEQYKTRGI